MKKNKLRIEIDPGSFKDPAGGVFFYKNGVYRSVTCDSAKFYQNFVNSEFFNELVSKKYFVPSKQVELNSDSTITQKFGFRKKYFEHDLIEFLSYPYEWADSMLIDAGIHTLDLQEKLLQENLSLKDATPYNVQFNFSKPIFIDLCSVEKVSKNGVWIAYNQFCQTFLYPHLMSKFSVYDMRSIFLSHMEGLTFEQTYAALKLRPFWRLGLIIDYLFPAIFLKLKQNKNLNIGQKPISINRTVNNSAQIQMHTVKRLKKQLLKSSPKKLTGQWIHYTKTFSYSEEEYSVKKEFIDSLLHKVMPSRVLDLGCNIGDFSIIAAKRGCKVISLDYDNDCINYLYNTSKNANYNILPLCIDISNPSPSIGWFNKERPSFLKRVTSKFDCVFALALIHHLLITRRIPLMEVFHLLKDLTSNYLIIEYVGKEDKKFKELLFNRTENYDLYDKSAFEKTASAYFFIKKKIDIINPQKSLNRCLYLMKKLTENSELKSP
jgi:ribosomal protein L11 methylase PrmA